MFRKLIVLLAVPLALASSADLPHHRDMTLDTPNTLTRVHHEPNVECMMTNFGFFGSQDGAFADPEEPGDYINGFEFPADSNINYLFQGALWIGATIDTVNNQGNPILDTLVTIGNDGWWGNLFEFMPPTFGYPTLWEDYELSDEDIHAIYYDTMTSSQYVPQDPNDGRPHIPLGLEIRQNSYAWTSPNYDEFIVVDFYIHNIWNRNLRNVWMGVYIDGDVHHSSEPEYADDWGAQDDLCGFVEHGEHGVAWIADDNGQPYDGVYDYRSPRGAIGMTLLRATEPGLQTNFNWWISNTNASLDWGPRWDLPGPEYPFPGGGMGTPGGDNAKYQVMSNGEHDYDQAFCALQHTGWIPPPPQAITLANGYDTRFLISFGPIALIPPGHVDTMTIGIIGGRRLHNDPANYANHLRNHETDSSSIAQYYAGLDFSDLIAKADTLVQFYGGGFPHPPLGPPRNFRCTGWSDNFVGLSWSPRNHPSLREYRIYRGTASRVYGPTPLTPANFRDTTFIDLTVAAHDTYYYAIVTIDTEGRWSGYSREVMVITGRPHTPTGLSAVPACHRVSLDWNDNSEGDIAGYAIYRSTWPAPYQIIDSSNVSSYIDNSVTDGIFYNYRVAAYDLHGLLSDSSESVFGLPMCFNSGILLINDNMTGANNPDYDSMAAFYNRILAGFPHTITTNIPNSLVDLAAYRPVIWTHDLLRGRNAFNTFVETNTIFQNYLWAGGNLLLAGPKQLVQFNATGNRAFEFGSFARGYLNIDSVEYPASLFETQFVGGHGVSPPFDDFGLDTARVNRIVYPQAMDIGRLFDIGAFYPHDFNEVIYDYVAARPESTLMEGRPIGVMHFTPNHNTAVLEAPLYFMNESSARQILDSILYSFQVDVADNPLPVPAKTALSQNYPNPFNARTRIEFALARECDVTLSIYNIVGQRVAVLWEGKQTAGHHAITWNAAALPSGLYFARLETPDVVRSVKMVMVK